ncbi:MAG: ABC transporter substrate-binding protein [Desulfobacterales bacterium]|jgi:peptide/nickel transport system substrate-binding protein
MMEKRKMLWGMILLLVLSVLTALPAYSAKENELSFALTTDPKSLDPRSIGGDYNFTILAYITERLCEYDMTQGKFIPVLATSWTKPDKLTWRFQLRQGVSFHNGEPFDAKAVKFTIDSIQDPAKAWTNASWVGDISEVKIVDDFTVDLITKKPSRSMLANLGYLFILPPKAADELGDRFGVQPIGTGKFILEKYYPNDRIVMKRNDNYWGQKPKMEKLTAKILPESATRMAALETGEVSLIPNLSPDAIPRMKANPKLSVVVGDPARIMHIAFILGEKPFDNLKVREAFNYAVDRQAIVDTVMMGLAKVADAHLYHPSSPGFNPNLKAYNYDPPQAKKLLAEAGYPDGITVTFGCPNGRYLRDRMVCEAIVGQMAEAGITVNLEALEWGTFWSRAVTNHEFDMFFLGWISPASPYTQLTWWFRTDPKSSKSNYSNPQVDELLIQAQNVLTDEEENQAYSQIQELLWNDLPWISLYFSPKIYGIDTSLKGVGLSEVVPLIDFTNAVFE